MPISLLDAAGLADVYQAMCLKIGRMPGERNKIGAIFRMKPELDAQDRRILAEKISTLPHVSNTSSHVSMEAVVEQNYQIG